MANGAKHLKLWQEAVALAGDVVRNARHGIRHETRAFLDRLIATAVAVPESIAEGYGRDDANEQQRLFESARASLTALETQLSVARQAGLIPADAVAHLAGRLGSVGRLLAGYLTYVERQRANEDGEESVCDLPPAATAPLGKPLHQVNRT